MTMAFLTKVECLASSMPCWTRSCKLWPLTISFCLFLSIRPVAAFTAIETEFPGLNIATFVVTTNGTPWAVIEEMGREGRASVSRLRYWDGAAFRRPDLRGGGPAVIFPGPRSAPLGSKPTDGDEMRRIAPLSDAPQMPFDVAVRHRSVFAGQDICTTGTTFSVSFIGGGDRDAWAVVRPPNSGYTHGRLVRLEARGSATVEEVPMPHWAAPLPPPLYVARDGRVFHWGTSFLAVRGTNGVWRRSAASLPSSGSGRQPVALVFERGADVWLFASPMLYRVDTNNVVTERLVPQTPVSESYATANRWGDDRIVAWDGRYPVHTYCFDIETLAPAPWPAFPAAWDVRENPVFVRRDGTVWLTKYENQKAVVAVSPDATRPREIPGVPFPRSGWGLVHYRMALECADGTIFSGVDGLTLIAPDNGVRRYGWRHGLAEGSTDVQQTSDGRIWFLNSGRIVAFDPAHEPQPLPGSGCWEQVADLAKGAEVISTNQPARSGGFFRFPYRTTHSIDGWEVHRLFDGVSLPISLAGTPLDGEHIMSIAEDSAGGLVFLTGQYPSPFLASNGEVGLRSDHARRHRYTAPCGVGAVAPPPATCGRTLEVPLDSGAAWRQRVHLTRIGEGPWQIVPASRAPVARFHFLAAGSHACEVIAFDYGGRVPGALIFTVQAAVELPDTLRRDGGAPDAVLDVNAHPWRPPVYAVPSPGGGTLNIVWRPEDETEWRTLAPGAALSVVEIGRGERVLLFCAIEDGVWRDLSPLRLPLRVALPLDTYLEALQQALRIYPQPNWVTRALNECGAEARARLNELAELAEQRARAEEALRLLESPREGGWQ